jgi:hypothetical protein
MKNKNFLYHYTKKLIEFMIYGGILKYVEDPTDA